MALDALQEILEELAQLPPIGRWVSDAACRGEAELFTAYPASRSSAAKVAAICDRCPVRDTCSDYAGRNDVDGVWAGTWHNTKTGTITDPLEHRSPRPADDCGTYRGYRRHRRQGEKACDACRAANSAQARRYRPDRG